MSKKPGDTFAFRFPVQSSTGALVNADGLPTGVMIQNGNVDGTVTITVTNISTGIYKASGTIPVGYAAGDRVQVQLSATVAGVVAGALFDIGVLDTKRNADLQDITAASVWAVVTRSLTDKAGFSLSTAPPTASDVVTALKADTEWKKMLASTVTGNFTFTPPPDGGGTATLVLSYSGGTVTHTLTVDADGAVTARVVS